MSYHPDSQSRQRYPQQASRRSSMSGWKIRLLIAGAIVLFSAISYLSSSSPNPVTGENQRVGGITPEQEINIGRNAAYEMVQQHQGLSRTEPYYRHVQTVGNKLVNALYQRLQRDGKRLPYSFDFHLLADQETVNAFALPGGQVFMTEGLYTRLTDEGQLAGVLAHEIGHVIERHGAERMANGQFLQRVAGAAGVAGGDINSAYVANQVLSVVATGYGRQAELESDRWGVELMALTGYHPKHILELMDILKDASGGGAPPEFMSTHPKPENRQKYIREVIAQKFPDGLPPGLR